VPSASPLVGETRFETAIAVAQEVVGEPTVIGLATGFAFPDALAGGAFMARRGGPMLLSGGEALPASVGSYLGALDGLEAAILFGGPAAISETVRQEVGLIVDG
jgi:hypothetical protein